MASPCARYLACAAPAPGVKPAPPPSQTPATYPPPTSPPPTSPPPIVVTCNNPGDQVNMVGDNVSLPITCTDSGRLALSYSATLPPGLAIGPSSGWITSTPTAPATYTVTITATDTSGHSGHTTFTWTILRTLVGCPSPGDQVNTVGDTVSLQISCTDSRGLALTYSDNGTLPPGLTINPATGLITGAPTTYGTYPVTITASDTSGSTGSATFTWTVNAPTPTP